MSKTIMSVYSLGDNNLRSSKYGISSSSTQYSGDEVNCTPKVRQKKI